MKFVLLLAVGLLFPPGSAVATEAQNSRPLAPSAQIEQAPSPSKLRLIRRFLRAIGVQEKLDSGEFLEHYALPGGPMWQLQNATSNETLKGGFERRFAALKNAYSKHRADYQNAYESHVNWEFSEAELVQIVGFLESAVGQHYLDGRWRMEAYVGTNTEDMEQQIVKDAIASLSK